MPHCPVISSLVNISHYGLLTLLEDPTSQVSPTRLDFIYVRMAVKNINTIKH